jgi:hypothetical protein
MLARGNHMAGVLLHSILYWSKYGSAKIPGEEGKWTAHDREWWSREACLSLRQYDRAISRLMTWGLVEKRQFWFAGRNILHVRPTTLTTDWIALASTWQAAEEFLDEAFAAAELQDEFTGHGKLGFPKQAISNGTAAYGNPSSPLPAMSNNMINKHHDKQTS